MSELYELPYGPDLVINGRGMTLTPKPDQVKFLFPLKPKLKKKVYKFTYCPGWLKDDWYTFLLILATFSFIVYFILIWKNLPSDFRRDTFDPNHVADYALESSGAFIIQKPSAKPYINNFWKVKNNDFKWGIHSDGMGPAAILQPWKSPGECWSFIGQQASVQIQLSHAIIPRAVTIEHIPKMISPTGNIESAPRQFTIWALDGEEKLQLGSFEYEDNDKSTQSFILQRIDNDNYPVRGVELQILSNHGHPHYTCVYKIRVHGNIPRL